MIGPTPLSNSNVSVAADVLKLLKALSQVPPAVPAKPNPAIAASLIGLGPLATIKDPTADSVMSIVQLGQAQPEAESAVGGEPENAAQEALARTTFQAAEQEYAANNAEALEQTQDIVLDEATKTALEGSEQTSIGQAANNALNMAQSAERSIPQQAVFMNDPQLFIQAAAYMQQGMSKSQAAAKKRRASWRFILQNKEDLRD